MVTFVGSPFSINSVATSTSEQIVWNKLSTFWSFSLLCYHSLNCGWPVHSIAISPRRCKCLHSSQLLETLPQAKRASRKMFTANSPWNLKKLFLHPVLIRFYCMKLQTRNNWRTSFWTACILAERSYFEVQTVNMVHIFSKQSRDTIQFLQKWKKNFK